VARYLKYKEGKACFELLKGLSNSMNKIIWILLFLIGFVVAPWVFVSSSQKVEYQLSFIGYDEGRFGRFLDIISGLLTFSGATVQWYLIDKFIFGLFDIHWAFIFLVIPVCLYAMFSWFSGLSWFIRSIIRLVKR